MRKVVIGVLSIFLGTVVLLDSVPDITGYVISSSDGFSFLSLIGIVLLFCGIALLVLDDHEKMKKN